MYADDLVLYGVLLNEVMGKYGRSKNAVERKGPRVSVNKIQDLQLLFGKKSNVSKVDPSGICGEMSVLVLILFSV